MPLPPATDMQLSAVLPPLGIAIYGVAVLYQTVVTNPNTGETAIFPTVDERALAQTLARTLNGTELLRLIRHYAEFFVLEQP